MTLFLSVLTVQALLGALDNLLHHELTEKLPAHVSARKELALHGARELIYALLFVVVAWIAPLGLWAWALVALLVIEIIITLADFLEEDRTRALPPFERVLHTILAVNFGFVLALAAPLWTVWAQQPTQLAFEPRGPFSWFFTLCALGVGAWGVRNVIASIALYARARRTKLAISPLSGRTVLITGATGFVGEALVCARLLAGDHVIVLTRDCRRARAQFGAAPLIVDTLNALPASLAIDAIINLAGAGVANAPWSRARKRALLHSRLSVTQELSLLITRLRTKPEVLVNASAVGFYGDRGEEALSETAEPGAGFTADLCQAWEQAAAGARAHGVRVVCLRFGLIMGRDGGAFPQLALPLALRVAVQFGAGRQYMAWIHKNDAVRLIETAMMDTRYSGPINAVAPTPTRHGEVIKALAAVRGGALVIATPAWAIKLLLGEMSALFLDSQRATPDAACARGFVFAFPNIAAAAQDLLGRARTEPGHPQILSPDRT